MIFTFLKGESRRVVVSEYHKRLAALCFALSALLFLIAAGLTLPSYISLITQKRALIMQSEVFSKKVVESGQGEVEKKLGEVENMIKAVKGDSANNQVVSIIEKIFSAKSSNISLSSVSLDHKSDSWSLSVGGRAATRESLVDFSKKLGGISDFSGIDLPVSSLAKNKDISFSITFHSKL